MDIVPFYVSFKLALVTTVILFFLGIPLALLFAYREFTGKMLGEILVTLPMALPPTVTGFYLLVLFSPASGLGRAFSSVTGTDLLFSFTGLVAASCIHSAPYMIQPLKNGMTSLDPALIEASYSLGKSRLSTLVNVILPNMRAQVLTGILMTFVHVTGEFGVVLMIGGSMPGRTKVASIALYEKVESMNYGEANMYALLLAAVSVSVISALYLLREKQTG